MPIQKQNIGNAGEYYIASRLSAENFIVTITLGRAERYDILAVSPNSKKTIKFSVKTRFLSDVKKFQLSKKDEVCGSEDFYYVFVKLNGFKSEPDFWIIPSKRVNNLLYTSHRIWLKELDRYGKKHKDVGMRHIFLELDKTSKKLFPQNWEKELKGYYKNIKQLNRLN